MKKFLFVIGFAFLVLQSPAQTGPTEIKAQTWIETISSKQVRVSCTDEYTYNIILAYPKFEKALIKKTEYITSEANGRQKGLYMVFPKSLEGELVKYIKKIRKTHI